MDRLDTLSQVFIALLVTIIGGIVVEAWKKAHNAIKVLIILAVALSGVKFAEFQGWVSLPALPDIELPFPIQRPTKNDEGNPQVIESDTVPDNPPNAGESATQVIESDTVTERPHDLGTAETPQIKMEWSVVKDQISKWASLFLKWISSFLKWIALLLKRILFICAALLTLSAIACVLLFLSLFPALIIDSASPKTLHIIITGVIISVILPIIEHFTLYRAFPAYFDTISGILALAAAIINCVAFAIRYNESDDSRIILLSSIFAPVATLILTRQLLTWLSTGQFAPFFSFFPWVWRAIWNPLHL